MAVQVVPSEVLAYPLPPITYKNPFAKEKPPSGFPTFDGAVAVLQEARDDIFIDKEDVEEVTLIGVTDVLLTVVPPNVKLAAHV